MSRGSAGSLVWLRERGMGASILVAVISSTFGVLLITATAYIGAMLAADPYLGDSEFLAVITGILGWLLTGLAVYVASIVTANTFATVVAGRTRQIALMRLVGDSARSQRRVVARQGLGVGIIGAALGFGSGIAAAAGLVPLANRVIASGDFEFSVLRLTALAPPVIVALTTWAAAWIGSRRVLTVTPLQALADSGDRSHAEAARPTRSIAALILGAVGIALLVLGVIAGLVSPLGVVVAFAGGLFALTAIALAATWFMPPLLRLVGRTFGRSATARMAAANALRHPERSSRMAIGVVLGVMLVTMFAVAAESAKALVMTSSGDAEPELTAVFDRFAQVMMGLVAVSAVIAAVGLVNLLTLSVMQRRRELGLLRALGLSSAQIRIMVLLEAAHIAITAVATGLVLGVVFGWVGAQSALGSAAVPPRFQSPTFVPPAVPWSVVLGVAAAAIVLTLIAAVVPTRLATRITPVQALAAA